MIYDFFTGKKTSLIFTGFGHYGEVILSGIRSFVSLLQWRKSMTEMDLFQKGKYKNILIQPTCHTAHSCRLTILE